METLQSFFLFMLAEETIATTSKCVNCSNPIDWGKSGFSYCEICEDNTFHDVDESDD